MDEPLFVSDVYEKNLHRRMSFPVSDEDEEGVSSALRDTRESNGSHLWRENYRQPALEFLDDESTAQKPIRNIISSQFWSQSEDQTHVRFPNY